METSNLASLFLEQNLTFRFVVTTLVCIIMVSILAYNNHKLREVEQENQRLCRDQEISKIQTLYAQNLSHDLRTPISVMKTHLYVIQKRQELNLPINGNLQTIDNYLQNLTSIVDDYAKISEIPSTYTEQNVQWQSVDLNRLINDVIETSSIYNAEKNIEIVTKKSCNNGCTILGEANYLHHMFKHLIHNSIQYGKPNGTVHIEVSKAQGNIYIQIEDDGIGIPSEHLDKIFEPFYRVNETHSMDTFAGSGMGLAIVNRIVKLHQGSIDVQSKIDKGTKFTIHLPCSPKLNSV